MIQGSAQLQKAMMEPQGDTGSRKRSEESTIFSDNLCYLCIWFENHIGLFFLHLYLYCILDSLNNGKGCVNQTRNIIKLASWKELIVCEWLVPIRIWFLLRGYVTICLHSLVSNGKRKHEKRNTISSFFCKFCSLLSDRKMVLNYFQEIPVRCTWTARSTRPNTIPVWPNRYRKWTKIVPSHFILKKQALILQEIPMAWYYLQMLTVYISAHCIWLNNGKVSIVSLLS